MIKKEVLRPSKITKYSRDFNNNVRATRRAEINGTSIDKNQLTVPQTWDLITDFFKIDNDAYKKLLNMRWNRND